MLNPDAGVTPSVSPPPEGRLIRTVLIASVFWLPAASLASAVADVPNPRLQNGGWVADQAEILNPATENSLNRMIEQLEAPQGDEIAVVTMPNTADSASPKSFATQLFNAWGIGKKGEDNGTLLLISKQDRRVEIETGYGVEAELPDAKVGTIIQDTMIPAFKQGDFNAGTLPARSNASRRLPQTCCLKEHRLRLHNKPPLHPRQTFTSPSSSSG